MTDLPDRWLMATSEWVRFTLAHTRGHPIAINPRMVTSVMPAWIEGSGLTIIDTSDAGIPIRVAEDFATVMDRLAGKRT